MKSRFNRKSKSKMHAYHLLPLSFHTKNLSIWIKERKWSFQRNFQINKHDVFGNIIKIFCIIEFSRWKIKPQTIFYVLSVLINDFHESWNRARNRIFVFSYWVFISLLSVIKNQTHYSYCVLSGNCYVQLFITPPLKCPYNEVFQPSIYTFLLKCMQYLIHMNKMGGVSKIWKIWDFYWDDNRLWKISNSWVTNWIIIKSQI